MASIDPIENLIQELERKKLIAQKEYLLHFKEAERIINAGETNGRDYKVSLQLMAKYEQMKSEIYSLECEIKKLRLKRIENLIDNEYDRKTDPKP